MADHSYLTYLHWKKIAERMPVRIIAVMPDLQEYEIFLRKNKIRYRSKAITWSFSSKPPKYMYYFQSEADAMMFFLRFSEGGRLSFYQPHPDEIS